MKKLLISLIACVAMSISSMAQLQLTPTGFINSENPEQGYVILDFSDCPQDKLYAKALVYLNSLYVSPKDVLSVVENESITINGLGKNAIYRQKTMNSLVPTYDVNYTITLLFKDNKLRVNMPILNDMYQSGDITDKFFVQGFNVFGVKTGVFDKKGKIMAEKTKQSLEDYFNDYIDRMKEGINTSTNSSW